MADLRKLANGTSQSEYDQPVSENKGHPFSQLLRRACTYSKEHPFLTLSILGAIASEAYFQQYTENQVELGLQQSNVIIAKRFGYTPFDLSNTSFLVMTKAIAYFATACNFSNDFLFLRPNDFIEGFDKAFPGGFCKGLAHNIKYTFSSRKNALSVIGPLLANVGAFAALSYSDVMTWDNPDSQGGNSAAVTALMAFVFYGGVFNYFMTQGEDTSEGAKFIFAHPDKSLKSLWHHFWHSPGMKATVFQTELVRESQNVIRGILGLFLAKYFLEARGVNPYATMGISVGLGIATHMQSFLARNPTGYKRNIGPEKIADGLLYRYDQAEITALQDRFLNDKDLNADSRVKRYWNKYSRLLNPVCLAETGLFSYFVSKLADLLPDSMDGLPKDYIAPGILGVTTALMMFKIFYNADLRKEISRKLEEEAKGKPDESTTSKFADWFAYISVVGAFTARTINGVPAMISFGEYLPFLNDLDKAIIAYMLGTIVNVAGYQYYYPKVRQSTQELIEFLKECFASPCCERPVSNNPHTMFGGKYNASINSAFMQDAQKPLLINSYEPEPEQEIDFSVSSVRGLTNPERLV